MSLDSLGPQSPTSIRSVNCKASTESSLRCTSKCRDRTCSAFVHWPISLWQLVRVPCLRCTSFHARLAELDRRSPVNILLTRARCPENDRYYFRERGGVQLILDLMQSHENVKEVQIFGSLALANFSLNNCTSACQHGNRSLLSCSPHCFTHSLIATLDELALYWSRQHQPSKYSCLSRMASA